MNKLFSIYAIELNLKQTNLKVIHLYKPKDELSDYLITDTIKQSITLHILTKLHIAVIYRLL